MPTKIEVTVREVEAPDVDAKMQIKLNAEPSTLSSIECIFVQHIMAGIEAGLQKAKETIAKMSESVEEVRHDKTLDFPLPNRAEDG